LPPTVAFALPLAFGHPFMFGFVNFALSMALALLAFGFWLRLGRLGKSKLRAILFVPISFIIFFAHTYGWGSLGLMCFSAEAVRQHDRGWSWWKAIQGCDACIVMALPLLLIVLWRTEATGGLTHRWFDWEYKWEYLLRMFRDRWEAYDIASAAMVLAVPVFALIHPRLTLSRNLAFSGLILAATYVLLPRIVFGSAYADMRLVPLRRNLRACGPFQAGNALPLASWLAVAAVGFMLVRFAGTTISMAMAWNRQVVQLRPSTMSKGLSRRGAGMGSVRTLDAPPLGPSRSDRHRAQGGLHQRSLADGGFDADDGSLSCRGLVSA
jgi:hypothetical protein